MRLDARIAPETAERLAELCARLYPGKVYAQGRVLDRAVGELYARIFAPPSTDAQSRQKGD